MIRKCGYCDKPTDGNPYWTKLVNGHIVLQCYACRGKERKEAKKKKGKK